MLDRIEYRNRLYEQIESVVMARYSEGMDIFDMLDIVLDSDEVEYVYDENAEPYMVKEVLTTVMIDWDMM